ncbi:GntR family transcriptional regulator [Paenisporosarcina sp. TG20]|uniref:GntR family transcriptional regulator n=1 Tax=Paenisporosarcina sp. TG20 TaxID=1211706 RepID=UPI00030B927F|nr:GntR family transcriptional regulator [Paenisporosarcina sp. TG20]
MKTTKKLNKRQYAYEVIRSRILDGTYAPGQRIIIDQIAKEVGSSAIPVREAIHQLESDQLIEYKANSGAVILNLNKEVYKETLELLAVLEGYATMLSMPYLTEDSFKELEFKSAGMKEALSEFDLETFSELNRDFHSIIYSFCPNQYILKNIQQMRDRLKTVRNTGFILYPKRAPQSVKEHDILIDMLRRQASPVEVENFARQHKLNTVKAFDIKL